VDKRRTKTGNVIRERYLQNYTGQPGIDIHLYRKVEDEIRLNRAQRSPDKRQAFKLLPQASVFAIQGQWNMFRAQFRDQARGIVILGREAYHLKPFGHQRINGASAKVI
jgi:hypothetical protein